MKKKREEGGMGREGGRGRRGKGTEEGRKRREEGIMTIHLSYLLPKGKGVPGRQRKIP